MNAPDPTVQAQHLLDEVWSDLEHDLGKGQLAFPDLIVWLNGAPGAGKGTNSRIIMRLCGLNRMPVVVSDLLQTPEFIKIKNSGHLVGDRDVIGLLLKKLLEPVYHKGVIVDGFPRSPVQAQFMRLLHRKLMELHRASPLTFPDVHFELIVLEVPEPVAVERQLKRGREALQGNEVVRRYGGRLEEIRVSDIDPAAAAKRYQVFEEHTVAALKSLADVFPFHIVDATGDIPAVARELQEALKDGLHCHVSGARPRIAL